MDATAHAEAPFSNGPFAAEGSSRSFITEEGRDARHDNQPPLEDRVTLEFEELLKSPGEGGTPSIEARVAELLASAARAPETIETEEWAGKIGDFLKLARAVEQRVEAARETQNRPLINARNALKARSDQLLAPLLQVGGALRQRLNVYVAREEEKRRAAERAAEEAARRTQEEADRIAAETTVKTGIEVVAPVVEAPRFERPVARGDLGSSVSGRTVWKHELQVPIAKLPANVLNNQKVIDAVDQVIASMVRGGTRKIKGVRIFETIGATVR